MSGSLKIMRAGQSKTSSIAHDSRAPQFDEVQWFELEVSKMQITAHLEPF